MDDTPSRSKPIPLVYDTFDPPSIAPLVGQYAMASCLSSIALCFAFAMYLFLEKGGFGMEGPVLLGLIFGAVLWNAAGLALIGLIVSLRRSFSRATFLPHQPVKTVLVGIIAPWAAAGLLWIFITEAERNHLSSRHIAWAGMLFSLMLPILLAGWFLPRFQAH